MHTKVSLVCEYLRVGGCTHKIRLQLHTQHTNYSVKAKKRLKLFVDEVKSGANRTGRRTRPDHAGLNRTEQEWTN